jgi:hypothetical protein
VHVGVGNASLWLGLRDGSVVKALADSIPVSFEAALPMHTAGCALPSSSQPSALLTALYQETAGPDYLLLYEAPPPYTRWKVRSRITPVGSVGNENWSESSRLGWAFRLSLRFGPRRT